MLNDSRISHLHDFADSRDCFPGVDIAGGICFFLWDREHNGKCEVHTIKKNSDKKAMRKLNEFENFIRDNLALEIIKKVRANSESFLDSIVSSRQPFGTVTNGKPEKVGDLILLTSKGDGRIPSSKITTGNELINRWKILVSKTSNDHAGHPDKDGKRRILSRLEIMPPKTICSESYLVIGPFKDKQETENMVNYLTTKFCRFLIGTILLTQNITKSKFAFVPILSMDKGWSDKALYRKFKLTEEEVVFIESTIRDMGFNDSK
jgi:site-specific DNA-methyltransferase (adenine-specific)